MEESTVFEIMSVNDPIYPWFYERRGTWLLMQWDESFYDENNILREFETREDALEWAYNNLNRELINDESNSS